MGNHFQRQPVQDVERALVDDEPGQAGKYYQIFVNLMSECVFLKIQWQLKYRLVNFLDLKDIK